jgi:hypothetical protein
MRQITENWTHRSDKADLDREFPRNLPHRRLIIRKEDNIRMDLREIRCGDE